MAKMPSFMTKVGRKIKKHKYPIAGGVVLAGGAVGYYRHRKKQQARAAEAALVESIQ